MRCHWPAFFQDSTRLPSCYHVSQWLGPFHYLMKLCWFWFPFTLTKNNFGKKPVLFGLLSWVTVHHWGKSGQELRQERWRNGACWFTPWIRLSQLYGVVLDHLPREWFYLQWLNTLHQLKIKTTSVDMSTDHHKDNHSIDTPHPFRWP